MESPVLKKLYDELIAQEVQNEANDISPSYAGIKAMSYSPRTFAIWVDRKIFSLNDRIEFLGCIHKNDNLKFFFNLNPPGHSGHHPSVYKGSIENSYRVLLTNNGKVGIKTKIPKTIPYFGLQSQITSSTLVNGILVVTMGALSRPLIRSRTGKKLVKSVPQPELKLEPETIPESEPEPEIPENTFLQDINQLIQLRDKFMELADKLGDRVSMDFDKNGNLTIGFTI